MSGAEAGEPSPYSLRIGGPHKGKSEGPQHLTGGWGGIPVYFLWKVMMDSQGPGKVPSCSLEPEVLGEQPTQASAMDKAIGP